ncbi:MAG: hypothetical protein JSS49_27500 [Planctomycetes bacterium]|nr:hypothetical protein [Planctomycetota bacterium]
MRFPQVSTSQPKPQTITMADGQTFTVLVIDKPSFHQRFTDEGRELNAYSRNSDPDAWANFRLGRIRDAIVDWRDVTNDKDQSIPFTFQRLTALMDAAPEVVPQLVSIANEVFRPLDLPSVKLPPPDSGETAPSPPETPTPSDSTATSDASSDSPSQSASDQAS